MPSSLKQLKPPTARQLLHCNNIPSSRCRNIRQLSSATTIKENDIVLLSYTGKNRDTTPLLTKPLSSSTTISIHKGKIKGSDIIGKRVRDTVESLDRRLKLRINRPTLAQYSDLSPRIVTPIYSQDASLIVSLLDLNPIKPSLLQTARSRLSGKALAEVEKQLPGEPETDDKLEIFEAGTGHGALTLFLARAIHAANPPAPPIPPLRRRSWRAETAVAESDATQEREAESVSPAVEKIEVTKDVVPTEDKPDGAVGKTWEAFLSILKGTSQTKGPEKQEGNEENPRWTMGREAQGIREPEPAEEILRLQQEEAYERYLPHRRAIIQTLDISPDHSNHARNSIRNFKGGIYFPSIDFHIGTIPEYLSGRLAASKGSPFFSHAILDLPRTHHYLDIVSQSLRPDGVLITWNPSLTQIIQCVHEVRKQRLPLFLESVLEVGRGAGVGGREWDVRAVLPRDVEKKRKEAEVKAQAHESTDGESDGEGSVEAPSDEGWEMICRPRVGVRVEGGGFIGVWKRMDV